MVALKAIRVPSNDRATKRVRWGWIGKARQKLCINSSANANSNDTHHIDLICSIYVCMCSWLTDSGENKLSTFEFALQLSVFCRRRSIFIVSCPSSCHPRVRSQLLHPNSEKWQPARDDNRAPKSEDADQ
jgi:hypothetical protein